MQTCYLAVDIGASSGRHIIGTVEHGVMALHEVYRFENRLIEKNGHLCWDMEERDRGAESRPRCRLYAHNGRY